MANQSKSLKIANEHGNFDLVHNKLPRGYVHVRGRVHGTARKLKLLFVPAVVAFRSSRYGVSPVTDGIVCTRRAAEKIEGALRPKRERDRRRRIAAELARMCSAVSSASSANALYPTPDSALPDACEAMFALNRYAKHSSIHRHRIYEAKNHLIRKLVLQGYLSGIGEHSVTLSAQECFTCDGEGCYRCDHTGYWRGSKTHKYYVLRFVVGNKAYTWHQPIESVDYTLPPVPTLEDSGDWDPREMKAVPNIEDVGGAITLVEYAASTAGAHAGPDPACSAQEMVQTGPKIVRAVPNSEEENALGARTSG